MKISIIIPTYNCCDNLELGLNYLVNQKYSNNVNLEIIVVDDGSNDNTKQVVNKYQKINNEIKYIFIERNILSCRSMARNAGIKKSTGDIISFLDSGMIIPSNYVENIYLSYLNLNSNDVLLHCIYGAFTCESEDTRKFINSINIDNLDERVKFIENDTNWQDIRENVFNSSIVLNSSKWVFAWSGALTFTREQFNKTGVFNESFKGWGGEDSEYAYRIKINGGNFVYSKSAYAIHIPHNSSHSNTKVRSSIQNRNQIFASFPNLETELYTIYSSHYYNYIMSQFESMSMQSIIPINYNNKLFQFINDLIVDVNHSVLIGTDNIGIASKFNSTILFTHNKTTFDTYSRYFKDKSIRYLLGVKSDYPDCVLDSIVITDFIRILDKTLQEDLIKESYRTAKKVYIIYTKHYVSPIAQISGCGWSYLDEIKNIASKQNLKLSEIYDDSDVKVFELTTSRDWYSKITYSDDE